MTDNISDRWYTLREVLFEEKNDFEFPTKIDFTKVLTSINLKNLICQDVLNEMKPKSLYFD